MSKIIFATLAALIAANDKTPEVLAEGPKIALPEAVDGSVSSSGSIQEVMYLKTKRYYSQ